MKVKVKLTNDNNLYDMFDVFSMKENTLIGVSSSVSYIDLVKGYTFSIPNDTESIVLKSTNDICPRTFEYNVDDLLLSYIYRKHDGDDKMNVVIEMHTLGGTLYADNSRLNLGFTTSSYETINAIDFEYFTMSTNMIPYIPLKENDGSVYISVTSSLTASNVDDINWYVDDINITTVSGQQLIYTHDDVIILSSSNTASNPVAIKFKRQIDNFIFNAKIK